MALIYVEEADLVLMALGFEPRPAQTVGNAELRLNRVGTIQAGHISPARPIWMVSSRG